MKLTMALLAALVTGCTSSSTPTACNLSAMAADKIAVDSVTLLKQHYPPAQTYLRIKTPPDTFGHTLAQHLREQGYGLQETLSSPPLSDQPRHQDLTYSLSTAGLDTVITLSVAGVSFHRLYQRQGQEMIASSYWSRGQS